MVLAMRLASTSASARQARPPTNRRGGLVALEDRRQLGHERGVDGGRRGRLRTTGAGSPPSDQLTSAGRIRVATWPGGPTAAATASAASVATALVLSEKRIQLDTLRATVSMSLSSWASYCLW